MKQIFGRYFSIRRITLYCAAALAAANPSDGKCYETITHYVITSNAATRSVLYTDGSLFSDWGYGDPYLEKFQTSSVPPGTANAVMSQGAVLEDSLTPFSRVFNHFYDPQFNSNQGRGLDAYLAFVGQPSPDWALEDRGDVVSLAAPTSGAGYPQQYSFREGQINFFNALTLASAQDRRNAMGRVFEILGHVVHHVQDMAQPQHTRNDTHRFSPANWYEKYTAQMVNVDTILSSNQQPIPAFDTARQFWTDNAVAYRGMADFTARNYVSIDTGFKTFGNGTAEVIYANPNFPRPYGDNIDSTKKTIESRTLPIHLPNGTTVNETMDYVIGKVYDQVSNTTYSGKLLAASSLLDTPLVANGQSRIFSTNTAVFDDNYSILLPRAAAFSAGLINHFFRGRLDMQRSGTSSAWDIRNVGSQAMIGTFRVFAEDATGARVPIPGAQINGTVASNTTLPITFSEPPGGTQNLVVVFQGKIGQEPANLNDPNWFAVAGKVVPYSPAPIPCSTNYTATGGEEGLDVVQEMGTSSGTVQLAFEAYSVPDSLVVTAQNTGGTVLATTNGLISGPFQKNFNFNASNLGTSKVRIQVSGHQQGTVWLLAMSCPGSAGLSQTDFPTRSVTFHMGSALNNAGGTCDADLYIDGAFAAHAHVSPSGGSTATTTLTVGPQHGAQFKNFTCSTGNTNLLVGASYTDGSGTFVLQNWSSTGIRTFDVH